MQKGAQSNQDQQTYLHEWETIKTNKIDKLVWKNK